MTDVEGMGGGGGEEGQPELQFASSVPAAEGGESAAQQRQNRERTPDSVKIFIGQVSKTATEQDLLPLLQPYGNLQELTIVKDKATNQSRGCAFAVFSNRLEANAAIQALHNAHIMAGMNNPIQVSIANGEQERMENKLFVGMIAKTASEADVEGLFAPFGAIEEVHVLRDKANNESKGCAFVKFQLRSSALAAIEAYNGRHQMQGAPQAMVVKFADSKKKETGPVKQSIHPHPPPGAHQQQQIRPQFQQFNQFAQQGWAPGQQWGGAGMQPNFPQNQYVGGGNGFTVYGGAQHAAGGDDRKEAGPPGANLFVYHIPPSFTDADLAATFQPFGALVSAKVYVDRNTGESKGFGFVSYDNTASAEAAISHMNGFQIGQKRLKVQHKKVHGAQAGRPY